MPVARGAERTAIHWVGADGAERRISFRELSQQSSRFGNLLRRIGIRKGDRVATMLPRTPEAVSAIVGVFRAGAILVPIFGGFGADAVAYRLAHSGTKAVCVGGRYRDLVPANDGIAVVTIGDGNCGARGGDIDGLAALGRESDACEPALYERSEPAVIIYTSGSTGQPKGCVIAANILAAMWPYVRYSLDLHADSDVFWPTGDPSWGYGLCCYLPALAQGASVLCVEANATPDVCRRIIERLQGQQSRYDADRAARTDGARRCHPLCGLVDPRDLELRRAAQRRGGRVLPSHLGCYPDGSLRRDRVRTAGRQPQRHRHGSQTRLHGAARAGPAHGGRGRERRRAAGGFGRADRPAH